MEVIENPQMIMMTKKEFEVELKELNKRGIYLDNITHYLDKKALKELGVRQVWVDDVGRLKHLPINRCIPYNETFLKFWGESYILGNAWCVRKVLTKSQLTKFLHQTQLIYIQILLK